MNSAHTLCLAISATDYLKLSAPPKRLKNLLRVEVTGRSFLPQADDLESDWVATVAAPVFKRIAREARAPKSFCSIGTGTGLDALTAIEILNATQVGVTDVHEEVVAAAVANIRANLLGADAIALQFGHGDLLEPLDTEDAANRPRYDLIYENLPNIPVDDASAIETARVSSSFVPPRSENIPELFRRNLLALHYVALLRAKDFLTPGGSTLSLLGARVPLEVFLEMGRAAGFRSEIYAYGWKAQTEAEAVFSGHIAQQQAGLGPFHFYRVDRLAQLFGGSSLEISGKEALALETTLAKEALSPKEAFLLHQQGERIGHTVAALRSWPI
ncbi:MAG: hypothetical protein LBG69_00685 [Zoogloeaceae bacterium]|jgi:hypothetical protein|nr:hypothetical protein [Zoogloeaceae bacterium]